MPNLQIDQPVSTTPQVITDNTGAATPIAVSTTAVGIGTTTPDSALEVAGDIQLEYNGSPKISLFSHGFGTQHYSIRATNNRDPAGGSLLVFRNESTGEDVLVLNNAGELKLERNGSPKITLYSRGNGTQRYSIRATNDKDPAGGRLLAFRNESTGQDVWFSTTPATSSWSAAAAPSSPCIPEATEPSDTASAPPTTTTRQEAGCWLSPTSRRVRMLS